MKIKRNLSKAAEVKEGQVWGYPDGRRVAITECDCMLYELDIDTFKEDEVDEEVLKKEAILLGEVISIDVGQVKFPETAQRDEDGRMVIK